MRLVEFSKRSRLSSTVFRLELDESGKNVGKESGGDRTWDGEVVGETQG